MVGGGMRLQCCRCRWSYVVRKHFQTEIASHPGIRKKRDPPSPPVLPFSPLAMQDWTSFFLLGLDTWYMRTWIMRGSGTREVDSPKGTGRRLDGETPRGEWPSLHGRFVTFGRQMYP